MIKQVLKSLIVLLLLVGCSSNTTNQNPEINSVYYEIFVGSFYDSDGDGMGDLKGVQEKLDYIQHDLGATGIWLMPINPSPTYHKYDVMDYKAIDEAYGTMDDFDNLVNEMNERGMDLILDLVLNHSSSQHPWFKQAISAQLNNKCDEVEVCDYYHFADHNRGGYHKLTDNLYYEGGFWREMPDLNLNNESLRELILDSAKFWLDKGVKGFRLDATTHFFDQSHESNVQFLKWFNTEVKAYKEDAYLVGEAWTSDNIIEDMYRSGIDSFFNFGASQNNGSIVKNIRAQNGLKLSQSIETYQQRVSAHNDQAIDAPFLSNHDNNRSAGYLTTLEDQKLAASIYLLLPGNPFIYYGEEIGMKGSGIDENKRLPILWDKTTSVGYTNAPKDANYTQADLLSVKEAIKDKNSLLNHYKHVISIRNQYPDISRGNYQSVNLGSDALYASRQNEVMIVHNLSDETQQFESDGKRFISILGKYKKKGTIIELEPKSSILIEEGR